MPIVFEQPQPFNPLASYQSGAADVITKSLGSMASLYEAAMRSRNSGSGSGGGGGHSTGIQVLPSGDGGALSEVEQQANREQSALNLGFEADQAQQLQQGRFQGQQNLMGYADSLQQQQDARAMQMYGGQEPPQPPPQPTPTFTQSDKESLAKAQMDLDDMDENYDPDDPGNQQVYKDTQAKVVALQSKQTQADNFAKQQAIKASDEAQGHAHGQMLRESSTMTKYSPGQKLPSGDVVVWANPDGSPAVIRSWSFKDHDWKLHNMPGGKTPADTLQENKFKHDEKMAEDKRTADADTRWNDRELKIRKSVEDKYKGDLTRRRPTADQVDEEVKRIRDGMDAAQRSRAAQRAAAASSRNAAVPAPGTNGTAPVANDRADVQPGGTTLGPGGPALGTGAVPPKSSALATPSPELVQRQTGHLDEVTSRIKQAIDEGRLDAQNVDQAKSAVFGLQELLKVSGGDIRTLPPVTKKRALQYIETLKTLPIDKRPPSEDALRKGYGWGLGYGSWR
jgi:hypothetical protein